MRETQYEIKTRVGEEIIKLDTRPALAFEHEGQGFHFIMNEPERSDSLSFIDILNLITLCSEKNS